MNKQQQILFYINNIPPDYGGGYLRTFKMAARFKEKNLLAGIITLTKKEQYIKTKNIIPADDILFLKTKLFIVIELFVFLFTKRKSFDVIYIVSSHWHTFFAVFICKILYKKVIVGITLSGIDSPDSKSSNFFINIYYKIKNTQFRLANKIIMNSPAVYKECINHGIGIEKLKLILNPVDTEKFKKIKEKVLINDLKDKFGIYNDNPIMIFVGSINRRKGVDLFPEILSKLSKQISIEVNFIMCGDLENDFSRKILNDIKMICKDSMIKFSFLGEINNINELMSVSEIFLLPTRNEGLPNVIIEAMSSSCIIFTNLLEDITDFLLPSEFIMLDNNINSYVKSISEVLHFPNIHEKTIIANRQRVLDDFNFEKIDNLFLEI
jgi:glycosyltransferase involved in cell wall biosynthesis